MENSKELGKKKVSNEDLDAVSGGHRPFKIPEVTDMKCFNPKCNFENTWLGNYMNGEDYDCPECHQKTFRGISVRKGFF